MLSPQFQFQPEQERVIHEAIQAGLIARADEVAEVGLETLRSRFESRSDSIRPASAEEWLGEFRAWAHGHPTTTPLLSDEAISRESIYGERGL
jgi:hypothetical protein